MRITLALIFLLGICSFAHGEVQNPNLIPFGEEEAFLGNAGIAHDESTGATYYNPGGLAFIHNKKISIYGNAYQLEHIYVRGYARLNNNDLPLQSNAFTPVPLSSVTIFGDEKTTYAFSVHVPFSQNLQFQIPLQTSSAQLVLVGNAATSTLWIGPSFARRISPTFGWGFSLYALRHASNAVSITNYNTTETTNQVETIGSSSQVNTWSALAILGTQWQLTPDWRFGTRIQTESVSITGHGSYISSSSGTNNGQLQNQLLNENNFDARYRLPWQIGFGTETTVLRRLELLADLNAQFPIDYQTAPTRPIASQHVVSRFTVRGNAGVKWHLGTNRSLLGGVLYNPGTTTADSSGIGPASSENFKGVTLGLQYDTGVLVTGIGGYFIWSNSDFFESGTNGTVTTPMQHQIYGLLLTASYKL